MFGLSRYFSRKFADDPYRASVDMIAPPKLSEFSELLIEAPMKGDLEQFKRVGTKQIPIVGKVYNEHFGPADQYKRKKRIQEYNKNKRSLKNPYKLESFNVDYGFED